MTTEMRDWIVDRRDDLVVLLQRLISTRSENPPGDEAAMASMVADLLHALGADVQTFEPAPGRTSVVGVLESGRPGPGVLCNAHLDTVPAGDGWTRADPFAGTIAAGRIYGRGAVDHKSPIAALIQAVASLQAYDRLRGRLVLVFDADEELGGALGMRHILERFYPDVEMALYAAPTSYGDDGARYFGVGLDNVVVASPGVVRLRATYSARTRYRVAPVDSWYPGEVAAAVATALAADRPTPRWFGGRPRARLVAGSTDEQIWDASVLPGETPDEVGSHLREHISSTVRDFPHVEVDVEVVSGVAPASCDEEHPLVAALLAGAERATGRTPRVATLCSITGMSPIQEALRIPVAAFGYGRIDFCHSPDESISVDEVVFTAVAYAETLAKLPELTHQRVGSEVTLRWT
jgi:succinyl-diaminopimelate desuccinylase